MIKGKTESGFKFEIDEKILDDFLVIKLAIKSDKGDINAMLELIDKVLDEKTEAALHEHIKTEDGRVPIETFFKEFTEIFTFAGNQSKNSSPSSE